MQNPKVRVLALDHRFLLLVLAPVQPFAKLTEILEFAPGNGRSSIEALFLGEAQELLDARIVQSRVEMGEREVPLRAILPAEHTRLLRLLQHHPGSVQSVHGGMLVANLLGDLVEWHPEVVVDPRDVPSFAVRLPLLGSIYVLEADVLPDLAPTACHDGERRERFLFRPSDPRQVPRTDVLSEVGIDQEADRCEAAVAFDDYESAVLLRREPGFVREVAGGSNPYR